MKVLSKKEQLERLEQPNAVQWMEEYVAASDLILNAAMRKHLKFYQRPEFAAIFGNPDPKVVKIANQLSPQEAKAIQENNGPIFTETWEKMIEIFPKEISIKLMVDYCNQHCYLHKGTLLKALDIFGKEAKDIIVVTKSLDGSVACKILRTFTREEAKGIFLDFVNQDVSDMDDDSQLVILRFFPMDDAVEIIKASILKVVGLKDPVQIEMFDVWPLAKCQEILELAIERGQTLDFETLKKVVDVFPKVTARKLIRDFFATDSGQNYGDEYKDAIVEQLAKKEGD